MNLLYKTIIAILIVFVGITSIYSQNVFTVTKTTDPDPFLYFTNPNDTTIVGTLQWAVRKANESVVPSQIVFNIPGSGQQVITLNSSLPVLAKTISIDGTSQSGYSYGNPSIVIDGNYTISVCINISNSSQTQIKGLHIQKFLFNNIIIQASNNISIIDNLITQSKRQNTNTLSSGISLRNATNIIFKGNFIGTDVFGNNLGNEDYGISLTTSCSQSTIGGLDINQGNTIAYNGQRGISITSGNLHKISGNKIFNNSVGIFLSSGVNNGKSTPIISNYNANGTVTGTSQPNDIIEIFGSTGNENANEYLTSTTADANGNWTALITNNSWAYVVATATDGNGNSSTLCEAVSSLQVSSCATAILIEPQYINSNYQITQLGGFDNWLRFKPTSQNCLIIINTDEGNSTNISKVNLYYGDCGNLTLINEKDFEDRNIITLNYEGLTTNGNYYIKINRNISDHINYAILLKNINTIWQPTDCYSPCNIVYNGDFETVDNPADWETAFVEDRVCQWSAVQYINTFLPNLIISDSYSGNNHAFLQKRWEEHCDTYQPEIYATLYNYQPNKQYKLELYYKIYLTNFNGSMNNTLSDKPIVIELVEAQDPYINGQSIGFTTNDNVTDWTYYSTIITTNNVDYHYLKIATGPCFTIPYNTITNILIDKISLTPINDITISTSANNICSGEPVNIQTEFSGISPQTYNWTSIPATTLINNNTATITANPTQQTTFNVTVTDDMDCSANASVTVNMKPVPIPAFIHEPTKCQWVDGEIIFTNQTPQSGSLTYLWDFGDGTTSTDENPTHIYQYTGYYCITLTAINDCGFTNTHTEQIYIYPNSCACDDNAQYTYNTENEIITQLIDDETVGVTVIVNSTCSIPDYATIKFGPKGRIIVNRGAKLIIGNNVTLTSLDGDCDYMWQGIEVWGVSTEYSNSQNQGIVELNSNVRIKNAHIAILSGARNMDYICNSESMRSKFNTAFSGGVIKNKGERAYFNNNGIGIRYIAKKAPYDASSNELTRCNFNCTSLLDPLYNSLQANHYPNNQNPFTANANTAQRTGVGLWIEKQRDMKITRCNFEYLENGIYSLDAKYNVHYSNFKNAYNGIKIMNSINTLDNRHVISICNFDLIPGLVGAKGAMIHITGGLYDEIYDNTFGVAQTPQMYNGIGIYTTEASAFSIRENSFYKLKYGIRSINSGNNGGYIGAGLSTTHPSWDGNKYQQCKINIATYGNNQNLRLKCNMCNNTNTSDYTVNFESYQHLANQGAIPPANLTVYEKSRYGAGNEFNELIPGSKKIRSLTNSYTYFHHISPTTAIPTLQVALFQFFHIQSVFKNLLIPFLVLHILKLFQLCFLFL
jgi:PKD repeat protein